MESIMGQALYLNMDNYLQGLFTLANDSTAEIRKLVRHVIKALSVCINNCAQYVWSWTFLIYFAILKNTGGKLHCD